MRLSLEVPKGWDEGFFEGAIEILAGVIQEADKSRRKQFEQVYTIETLRRRIIVTVRSEPMR